jgi:beta-phosphoglucomutase-like phosphatase (HAD superfamily)
MDAAIAKSSFLFDLDGTLVDSVYQHVLAWREALEAERHRGVADPGRL